MLMTQLQDANLRQSVMQYINQTANALDKDTNCKALIETLARESVHNQKSAAIWKSRTNRSAAVGVVAVVLAITVQFLVNYFTNELSKESHVDNQGAMVSTDGQVVKIQMEEMKVGVDGALRSRNGDATVKTMPTLAKVALDSSLPDATLMALEEISVHSEKGYTLQIKVHGFSRVPVLNSRCGNVVHFYTAWKGKVTLDSTDLLLDETTAAEFRGAGFSIATGGRRLAGEVSLDAFVRAIDDAKRSGKWTCANIPLPIVSVQGSWQMTVYRPCGAKKDKEQNCYSSYGGLQLGVTALDDTLFSTPETDQNLFWTTSSSQMKSARYGVILKEYPMHPGQQLVTITDFASDKFSIFQIESDQKRSHCSTGVEHEANPEKRPGSGDNDWHIEYTGITEVDGKILRGFNARLSAEAIVHLFGESRGNTAVAQFWDIAENLQPYAFSSAGSGGKMDYIANMFRSYKHDVTDGVVETSMKELTGKNVTELLSCTENEKNKNGRPTMRLQDLTNSEVGYYVHSSVQKSGAVSKYLEDATNVHAMSDFCYEICKDSVDVFRSLLPEGLPGDVCPVVRTVVDCLQREMKCHSSKFIYNHERECHTDTAKNFADSGESGRLLEADTLGAESGESGRLLEADTLGAESGEPVQLFVNETGLAQIAKTSRKLNFYEWDCLRDGEKHPRPGWLGGPQVFKEKGTLGDCSWSSPANVCWCIKFAKKTTNWSFTFTIKWGLVGLKLGLFISATACAPLTASFPVKLKPALDAEQCYGGSLTITPFTECPSIPLFNLQGQLSADWTINLWPDTWAETSLGKASLIISAGMVDYTGDLHVERNCWWQEETDYVGLYSSRRRQLRRRYYRSCPDGSTCDIYVKAELAITLLSIGKVGIDVEYYFYFKILTVKMSVQYKWVSWTGVYWETLHDDILYTRSFKDYSEQTSENEHPVVHGCEWQEHWGYWSVGKMATDQRMWTAGNDLAWAKSNAMRECAKQKQECKAVQCWSLPNDRGQYGLRWRCQMRADTELVAVPPTHNQGDYRDQVYTAHNCGLVTVPPPPVPQYHGPDFVGGAVWTDHWGRVVPQKVWGPAGNRLWKNTLHKAKKKAMENCKFHNSVVTGKANGLLCKAVVCWSTLTIAFEQQYNENCEANWVERKGYCGSTCQEGCAPDYHTEWKCMLRGNRNHEAAATTVPAVSQNFVGAETIAFRVRTYTAEACQRCDMNRWTMHWGLAAPETAHVKGSSYEKCKGGECKGAAFVGTGSRGINNASNDAKRACGHHNTVTTGNLCKGVVCWTQESVYQQSDAAKATWQCQMTATNVLVAPPWSNVADTKLNYRVQSYLPEACS